MTIKSYNKNSSSDKKFMFFINVDVQTYNCIKKKERLSVVIFFLTTLCTFILYKSGIDRENISIINIIICIFYVERLINSHVKPNP